MNVLRIVNHANRISSVALGAVLAVNDGNSTGVERALSEIELSLAAIRTELNNRKETNPVGEYEDIDAMSDAVMWKKPRT